MSKLMLAATIPFTAFAITLTGCSDSQTSTGNEPVNLGTPATEMCAEVVPALTTDVADFNTTGGAFLNDPSEVNAEAALRGIEQIRENATLLEEYGFPGISETLTALTNLGEYAFNNPNSFVEGDLMAEDSDPELNELTDAAFFAAMNPSKYTELERISTECDVPMDEFNEL